MEAHHDSLGWYVVCDGDGCGLLGPICVCRERSIVLTQRAGWVEWAPDGWHCPECAGGG